jgi:hypothetical protein
MAYRTTQKQCQTLIDHINQITHSPVNQWEPGAKGNEQNIGHYLMDWNSWHDRVTLARICTPGGGITHPLGETYYTIREFFHVLHAYIYGLKEPRA